MTDPTNAAAAIQFGAITNTHVLLNGRLLCGRQIDERDLYQTVEAGLRVWERQAQPRCATCETALKRMRIELPQRDEEAV